MSEPVTGDLEVRLNAVLDWLEQGRITVEQAAARISAMKFPPPAEKTVRRRQEDDANGDPEAPGPGSPFAISAAYAAGRIDAEQYATLARAAAQAIGRVPGA
jgi:hypothetical protein